ncbi:YdhK family protein [Corynebacterium ureicelerivorans]|nr:YdhK family protein [Corynebacterium ureicelerivorans]MDN8605448.1 YdhK family protein [Corynebacterium ureicelerivorans]
MRISQPLALTTLAAVAALAVAGCASESDDAPAEHADHADHADHAVHSEHEHPADGGPAPAGIAEATDPTYPVGAEVTLTADHMPGMDGATATISGAFDTTAYAVSYTPTDGGDPVTNHKWVVQEELEGVGDEELAPGDTAVMTADHMPGMQGAEATIDSSTDETVYMVDIDSPDMTMKRHKWVVESEIQPK